LQPRRNRERNPWSRIKLRVVKKSGDPLVLWASRHEPIKAEVDALLESLGDVAVVQLYGELPNAELVMEVAEELGARYIVAILPLTFVKRLTEIAREKGVVVLRPSMREARDVDREPVPGVDYDPDREVVTEVHDGRKTFYRVFEFLGYEEVLDVQVVTRPLQRRAGVASEPAAERRDKVPA